MITKTEILTGSFSLTGEPWVKVASGDIDPNTLQFSLDGSPWWGVSGGSIETIISGNIKRILKVDWPYVKTVINVEG